MVSSPCSLKIAKALCNVVLYEVLYHVIAKDLTPWGSDVYSKHHDL
jgi:hypothetical protein